MSVARNPEHRTEHIKGRYLVLVALITFAGGYFLNPPITRAISKKYSNIGGVWKAHGDLLMHGTVSTIKDTFYIRMEGEYVSNDRWIIQGKGIMDHNSGDFTGNMIVTGKDASYKSVWGHAEMAGSDQLGVTIFFDETRTGIPRSYGFIREGSPGETAGEDKKE